MQQSPSVEYISTIYSAKNLKPHNIRYYVKPVTHYLNGHYPSIPEWPVHHPLDRQSPQLSPGFDPGLVV